MENVGRALRHQKLHQGTMAAPADHLTGGEAGPQNQTLTVMACKGFEIANQPGTVAWPDQ